MYHPHHPTHPQRQRGVALFVVIVFVMLAMLLALWASRTALFNEMVVGNDADYQRAFEAAQAMLQDAELDIRNETAIGSKCTNCRRDTSYADSTKNPKKFPTTVAERDALLIELTAATTGCINGLCTRQTDWSLEAITDATNPKAAKNVGARYGEYTKALHTANSNTNPLLQWVNWSDEQKVIDTTKAWYWIEILPYLDETGGGVAIGGEGSASNQWLPILGQERVAYRVTAWAKGLKPTTNVILQQVYIRRYHSGDGDDI